MIHFLVERAVKTQAAAWCFRCPLDIDKGPSLSVCQWSGQPAWTAMMGHLPHTCEDLVP